MTAAPSHSFVIRNARIVDGSGGPSFAGDVAIKGDRIAAVGSVSDKGDHEIDAGDKVLAPGFIDIHTHYDPQLCWDRSASPSPEHGVTSLVMGNCSISLAPVRPADVKKVIHLFGSVEDMEGRLLEETVPFGWETVPEYLDYLRQGLGPNVGVLIGHSVLRLYVMGKAAQERAATPEEIERMAEILGEAIEAGAMGLSFTFTHLDETGRALPCSFAERGEIAALMHAMKARGRGIVEVSPHPLGGKDVMERIDFFGSLALETGVTCTLSPILQIPSQPGRANELLQRVILWREKGAPLFAQTQTRPLDMTVRLDQGSPILSKAPTWRKIMDMSTAQRIKAFSDPALRDVLYEEGKTMGSVFDRIALKETRTPANEQFLQRSLREIAEMTGKRFTDAFIDISLDDDLEAVFSLENFIHADTKIVSELLDNPAMHVGSGDAGAHITSFSGAGDTCYLIEKFVREEGMMTLERAVQRLTSDIAEGFGIAERGVIAPGMYADLVLFDPDRITRGEEIWVDDVPGGNGRYVRHPEGIEKVMVNGVMVVEGGKYSGETPGRLI